MSRSFRIPFCTFAVAAPLLVSVTFAAEFVPPPEAEREAVAAIAKQGTRIVVDGDYRVVQVTLGAEGSNDDLKRIASFERLTQLQIQSPAITDEGLEHLKNSKKLTSLLIASSGSTEKGLASLRTALPDCRISNFPTRGFPSSTTNPGDRGPRGDRGDRGTPDRGTADRGPRTSTFTTFGDRGSFTSTGFGTRMQSLARNVAVQDDLKLSSDQRQQLSSLSDTAALNRLIDEKVAEALTPDQRSRLKQIELQQSGIAALGRQDVADELKLSDTQLAELRRITDEASAALRTVSRDLRTGDQEAMAAVLAKSQELTKQREEKMLAVLTDEQRQAWQKMLGPKGPDLTNASASALRGSFTSVSDLGRSLFLRYDANNDGALSDEEFPESNRTRSSMSRSGATLTFPVKREDFEKAYSKYVESLRPRQ